MSNRGWPQIRWGTLVMADMSVVVEVVVAITALLNIDTVEADISILIPLPYPVDCIDRKSVV